MSQVLRRKTTRNQLYFDFIGPEEVPKKENAVPRKTKISMPPSKRGLKKTFQRAQNTGPDDDPRALTDLCLLLYGLARKHVAPANFADFCLLTRCTKLLQDLGLEVEIAPEMQAHVRDAATVLVTAAPEYRMLRSKATAGLATVADLVTKLPAKGNGDYQRGMRDAYEQASEIAALFLDDLEQFQFPRRSR